MRPGNHLGRLSTFAAKSAVTTKARLDVSELYVRLHVMQ